MAMTSFVVPVDYGQTVEEGLKDLNCDRVNIHITRANFPHDRSLGKVNKNMKIVPFYREIEDWTNIAPAFFKLVLRPANLMETMAFGKQNPHLQRKLPIVGTGSCWVDPDLNHYVSCLWGVGERRYFDLYFCDDVLDDAHCFLGVCE